MTARTPSAPPLLDGYTQLDLLGSGGFADVFKYQQLRPRREVAVKVLLRGLGPEAQRQFEAEANLMAMLSNHPSIVSIFAAGVAPDGRPYLVMENCQAKHLGARLRQKPLPVGRALEIGIQVAGAVETAHRLGILHRDIKPANILFTDFGRPALTDFGISVAEGGQGAAAFSVAWAPPEQIENRPMGATGDVYSLAATVWAMIAGRSPFDVTGDNGALAITRRVKTQQVPPTGRAGVPESLERVLRTAMSKSPGQRYGSALEFARALQGVQAELHESVTTIDVREERTDEDYLDLTEAGTRVTGFAVIDPDVAPERTASGWIDVSDSRGTRQTGHPHDSGTFTDPATVAGSNVLMHGRGSKPAHEPLEFTGPSVPQVPDDATYFVGAGPSADEQPVEVRRKRALVPVALASAALLVAGGLGVAWFLGGQGSATVGQTTVSVSTKPKDPMAGVPQPANLSGVVQGSNVVFTWTNPSPLPGDRFNYRPVLLVKQADSVGTTELTATIPAQNGLTCIEVELVRKTGQFSDFAKKCAS